MRLLVLALLGAIAAPAEVTLAPLFTDHAVLQRDKPVPVWGKADPREKVRVEFLDQHAETTAGADGRWILFLDKFATTTSGADLTVAGKNRLVVHDVVVGEVWLCSGQSNMEFTVEARPGTWQSGTRAVRAAAETAAANFPLVRHVRIEHTVADAPADTVATGGWEPASPRTVGGFTAVGYFFAREIFQKLGVPVGLVHSSWGGTPIESWMSPSALASDPAFKIVGERWARTLADYPAAKAAYDARPLTAYLPGRRPRAPRGPGDAWTPSGLFNGMINPLLPYALRGALWYQGESNTEHAGEYRALFGATISSWRAHFGQGDFPFYWVSLANYADAPDATWAFLREAQTQTLALPHTGQALAIDLGEPNNIHPANKQDVGRRLALLARNRVYGIMGDDTGPTLASATREGLPAGAGAGLRVRFTHATGLIAHDKPVQALEIAGADRKFFPAAGKIERDTLLVFSPQVKEPVAVRYAWKNAPEANLYNSAGLPAVPFRSDSW